MFRRPRAVFMASLPAGGLVTGDFRLALTGTPGTGKSTVARNLSERGYTVVSVESLAREHECLGEVDPADGARSIDLDMLHDSLASGWSSPPEHSLIIDGHLSHHLPSDAVAVLRCSPDVLEARLASRGYSAEKTQANCEWELLGGAWNERERGFAWIEFDTTNSDVASVVESLLHWISDGFKPASPGSVIDWVARMEE